MAKEKRKDVVAHNMHSYFGKKGRSDDPVTAPVLDEQEEPQHVEEEIIIAPITPAAPPPPPPQPVSVHFLQ